MAGRVNRRGWIVVESIGSTDGGLCVDFFEDPAGGYGYAHFRTDAEDRGAWTIIGNGSNRRYQTPADAVAAAIGEVPWLQTERRPRQALETLGSSW